MTIVAALGAPSRAPLDRGEEERIQRVDEGTRVLVRVNRASARPGPALVLVHGLTGSSRSPYMRRTARKALAAGLHVVRLNVRNCEGTEHLSRTSYHGGLTREILVTARHLVEEEGCGPIVIAGFSMGGNMVLKLAGELSGDAPAWLAGVAAVSPPIDFAAASARIDTGTRNRFYQRRFIGHLGRMVRRRQTLYPEERALGSVAETASLRAFDDRFTAPLGGFAGVDDYYRRASAARSVAGIRVPTLVIGAEDDPIVPIESVTVDALRSNPHVRLVTTELGGHLAFLAGERARGAVAHDRDRRWAENRVLDFFLGLPRVSEGLRARLAREGSPLVD